MSQTPQISVIIPLYNKVNEVGRAVESILNQTYQNFVIIVVGGRSTDGSEEVLKKYPDTRIRFVQETGNNVAQARNQGIEAAETELIAFLDADDEWKPAFLETIVKLHQKYPNAGLYSTAYERHAIKITKPSPVKGLPENFEGYIENYFKLYVDSGFPPFTTSSTVLDKKVFPAVGLFRKDARISEDLEMWMKVAYHFPIVFTTEIHVRHNIFAENKTSQAFYAIDVLPPVAYLKSRPKEELMKRADYADICTAIEYMNLIAAYWNVGAGNMEHARKLLQESHSSRFVVKRTGLRVLSALPGKFTDWVIKEYTRYATML